MKHNILNGCFFNYLLKIPTSVLFMKIISLFLFGFKLNRILLSLVNYLHPELVFPVLYLLGFKISFLNSLFVMNLNLLNDSSFLRNLVFYEDDLCFVL